MTVAWASPQAQELVPVDLPPYLRWHMARPERWAALDRFAVDEREFVEAVLERTGGNQLRAAEALGINRNTLRKRITALGIDIPKERG